MTDKFYIHFAVATGVINQNAKTFDTLFTNEYAKETAYKWLLRDISKLEFYETTLENIKIHSIKKDGLSWRLSFEVTSTKVSDKIINQLNNIKL